MGKEAEGDRLLVLFQKGQSMIRRTRIWTVSMACLALFGSLAWGSLLHEFQARAHAEPAAKAEPKRDETIAQLRARVEQLEKEVSVLKRESVFGGMMPRQAKATPEELAILRELVDTRLATWRSVYAKFLVGGRGGSASDEARARTFLFLALARLAYAQQQDQEARDGLEKAVNAAEHMVQCEQSAYEQGAVTLDIVVEAQEIRAQVKATCFRAGGLVPKPKHDGPWELKPGEMPEPYPEEK